MRITLVIFLVVVAVVAGQLQPDFKTWKEQNKKTYPNAETEAQAKNNYEKNAADINKFNSNSKSTYKQSVNSDSDKNLTKSNAGNIDPKDVEKQEQERSKQQQTKNKVKSSGSPKPSESRNSNLTEEKKRAQQGSEHQVQASIPTSLDLSG